MGLRAQVKTTASWVLSTVILPKAWGVKVSPRMQGNRAPSARSPCDFPFQISGAREFRA